MQRAWATDPQMAKQSGKYLRTEERSTRSAAKDGRLLGQSKLTQSQTFLEAEDPARGGTILLPCSLLCHPTVIPRGLFLTLKCHGQLWCLSSAPQMRGPLPRPEATGRRQEVLDGQTDGRTEGLTFPRCPGHQSKLPEFPGRRRLGAQSHGGNASNLLSAKFLRLL